MTPAQNFALVTGNLRQPLFEAAVPASFRRGDVGVIVAEQTFQDNTVKILHQARVEYYTALLSRSSVQLFLEMETPLDDNIKLEKDRITTGLSARSSLITAEIRKLQYVPAGKPSKNAIRKVL